MRVVISERAGADLRNIYGYLADRSPNAAESFIHRIDRNYTNLAKFPFLGRDRWSFAPGIRCLVVGLHLVFYIVESDQIVIVRVIDARMDVDEEFYR